MKAYQIQKPNATAVNLLRSWLTATNTPFEPGTGDVDLVINGLPVKVCPRGVKPTAPTHIRAGDITGRDVNKALGVFWKITEAAGCEKRNPLVRSIGTPNEDGIIKRASSSEDFLIAIRHSEFRKSPNPAPEKWGKYEKTIVAVSKLFFYSPKSHWLCKIHGLERQDLMQYARCLMVNYCSLYEISNPLKHDNERLFYQYLKQRFILLRKLLSRKVASVDIPVGTPLTTSDPEVGACYIEPEESAEELDVVDRLKALEHDAMLTTADKILNSRVGRECKTSVRAFLRLHRETCDDCPTEGAESPQAQDS